MINREDMLELTRRMTVKRNCFDRIAGAYMDADGYVDGTFNTSFLSLSPAEKEKNLQIAKTIPFATTNQELREIRMPVEGENDAKDLWKLLLAIKSCGLKNDALLDTFYEIVGERFKADADYAIILFHGIYDIPRKGADHESQWESEDVFEFIICAVCPLTGRYDPGKPEWGFLFPAFTDRSGNLNHIDVYRRQI